MEYDEDEEPTLVLAGENETVSQNWMAFLRAAFWKNTTITIDSLPPLGPGMFIWCDCVIETEPRPVSLFKVIANALFTLCLLLL